MGKILRGQFKQQIPKSDYEIIEPVFLEDTLPKNLVWYYQPPRPIKRS